MSLITLAAAVSSLAILGGQAKAPQFPAVKGENLNKKEYQLPADFEGDLNIVFLAYYRQQQDDVNTWLDMADAIRKEQPKVKYYELPVLASFAPEMRNFIDNGMRSGIPDPAVRAITITLYLDQKAFMKSLHLEKMDQIHTIIVDRKGKIYWTGVGRHSADKEKSLRAALAEAMRLVKTSS